MAQGGEAGGAVSEPQAWWLRFRLWRLRRGMHLECAQWQLQLWHGIDAPMGACTRCLPRMVKIRDLLTPRARIHLERGYSRAFGGEK